MKKTIGGMLGKGADLVGDAVSAGAKAIDIAEDKISHAKDKLFEYVPELDIDKVERSLEQIGYRIPRVEIALTIPPRIAMEIDLNKSQVNKEVKDQILNQTDVTGEENDSDITDRVIVKIIQGLDAAVKMKDKLHFKNKKLSRVVVEGSLIPTVKMIYLDEKEISRENSLD